MGQGNDVYQLIEIGPGLLLKSKGRSLSENYFGTISPVHMCSIVVAITLTP
jgi:hypothetical protein